MSKNMYVNNAELLEEIKDYKNTGVMSENLGRMVMSIAQNLSTKGNFVGYTWRTEMVSEAVLTVVKYLHNFNLEKYKNPFSYITQICYHSFLTYIKKQKRHSAIKNTLFNNQKVILSENTGETTKSIDYTLVAIVLEEEAVE